MLENTYSHHNLIFFNFCFPFTPVFHMFACLQTLHQQENKCTENMSEFDVERLLAIVLICY